MNHRAVALICLSLASVLAPAQDSAPPPEIGIVERLGETLPLDQEFYDEKGNLVTLRSVIDKPTIVTFVYYRCPGICTPLLTELSRIVDKMDLEPGIDYKILTISFDHHDTPDIALEKQENYLSSTEKPVSTDAWRFFTGDSLAIRAVTSAAGFYFKPSGKDWIHAGALIVVTHDGKVARYIYGIKYLPFDVKMAVLEASNGRTGPTIARVLTFCYRYDPEGRTYAFNITRVALVVILLLAAIFIFVFILRPRNRKAAKGEVHGQVNESAGTR